MTFYTWSAGSVVSETYYVTQYQYFHQDRYETDPPCVNYEIGPGGFPICNQWGTPSVYWHGCTGWGPSYGCSHNPGRPDGHWTGHSSRRTGRSRQVARSRQVCSLGGSSTNTSSPGGGGWRTSAPSSGGRCGSWSGSRTHTSPSTTTTSTTTTTTTAPPIVDPPSCPGGQHGHGSSCHSNHHRPACRPGRTQTYTYHFGGGHRTGTVAACPPSPTTTAPTTTTSSTTSSTTTTTAPTTTTTVPAGWSDGCDWVFEAGVAVTRLLPVAPPASLYMWTGDEPTGMRMRFVNVGGVWAQQLSGTPTAVGVWAGSLAPRNPTPDGVANLDCSFEVISGTAECSLTIPADQMDTVRAAVSWQTDVAGSGPGGSSYEITTGDPAAGGGSPRVWPVWSSDADLTVTDTSGCVWTMTEVISSAHPLFVWYAPDRSTVRSVSAGLGAQWDATSAAQRREVERAGRALLARVGLGEPEDNLSVGGSCQPGDTPQQECVWGIPFPGVWQWSLVVRYESTEDAASRDLTVLSGTSRFWKFADRAG